MGRMLAQLPKRTLWPTGYQHCFLRFWFLVSRVYLRKSGSSSFKRSLVYSGKAAPSGQDADVTLTMDQYRQDQNVYLHHEEHKVAQSVRIEDGLSINARPDWAGVKEEYKIYSEMDSLSPEQRDELRLKSLQAGKISSNGLFFGVKRGVKDNAPMMIPAFSSRTSGDALPSSSTSITITNLTSRSMIRLESRSPTN
jgi:hypothetical protein